MAQLESEANNRAGVESIFHKTLKDIPHLQLWRTYLDHIRRYFNIAVDKSGTASQTNHAAYDAVLDAVGIDKDAGNLWQDFITFIKSGPGVLGQQDWQSQSKMDLLRKAYQDAISVPTQAVEAIWKDYSMFENSLNKMTVGPPPLFMIAKLLNCLGSPISSEEIRRLHVCTKLLYRASQHHPRLEAHYSPLATACFGI